MSKIAKITNEEAEILLKENDFDLPMVILIQRLALTQNESRDLLAKHNGNLSKILK